MFSPSHISDVNEIIEHPCKLCQSLALIFECDLLWKEIAACAVEHFLVSFFIYTILCHKDMVNIHMGLGQVVNEDCVELVRPARSSGKALVLTVQNNLFAK